MSYTEAAALLRDTLQTLAVRYCVETGASPKGVSKTLAAGVEKTAIQRQELDSRQFIFGLTYNNFLSIDRTCGVVIALHQARSGFMNHLPIPFLEIYPRYLLSI